jgi:3-phenylpropionate/trans-cinnamate dioxygenase ferredoxin reductase component
VSGEADSSVLIVGAGQGGAQTAMVLRQQKFAGSVLMIGAEAVLPYERPALSKEYLAGDKAFEKLLLRPPAFWQERHVEVRLGKRVAEVDPSAHCVRTTDGNTISYNKLVWAAGGQPRRLRCPGAELAGVHYVREREDVDRIRSEIEARLVRSVAVIGGGYIGLEAAAVLRKQDKRVTVIEAQDRVLSRVAAEPLARFFEAEHRAHGVDVRLATEVTGIEGDITGCASGVRLGTGEVIPADLVIVGIGIDAVVEPLLAAGADVGGERGVGGVLVDLEGKTSLPDVYAVGDCAAHLNRYANGRTIRVESIQNANDQAAIVAKSIAGSLGIGERYDTVPWFWSNQYDLRLQTVGLWVDHDEIIVRGDPAARSFSIVYLRAGRVIALDCVNLTKDYVQGKPLIASGREIDRSKLARADVMLKELT